MSGCILRACSFIEMWPNNKKKVQGDFFLCHFFQQQQRIGDKKVREVRVKCLMGEILRRKSRAEHVSETTFAQKSEIQIINKVERIMNINSPYSENLSFRWSCRPCSDCNARAVCGAQSERGLESSGGGQR